MCVRMLYKWWMTTRYGCRICKHLVLFTFVVGKDSVSNFVIFKIFSLISQLTLDLSQVNLRLYLALVRPHLDYAAQFWSPYYRNDISSLEAVQRRLTKMIQGLRNLPYKDRLKRLNLHSLEGRRARGGYD